MSAGNATGPQVTITIRGTPAISAGFSFLMEQEQSVRPDFRTGYVAIIGDPNAGKSTLMNAILGQKVSIVSDKPQTTRHKVLGILSGDAFQVVFLDTPGLITPKYLLQEAMMANANAAINDADVILVILDAAKALREAAREGSDPGAAVFDPELLQKIRERGKPVFLVLNKTDLTHKPELLPLIARCAAAFSFAEIFPVSALRHDGLDVLLTSIVRLLPVHPPYYPLDIVSEHNERFFVAEMIREQVFHVCHEEIPYSTTVEIIEFKEREAGKWFISADVYVERDSQKKIVIGAGGAMLKEIGQRARREVERFLEHPVFLELHVKVREKWREQEEWLRRLGYR